jgi:hypothetical protein
MAKKSGLAGKPARKPARKSAAKQIPKPRVKDASMPQTRALFRPPPATAARRVLNCLPSVATESDWSFGAGMMAGVADTKLPASMDLREAWWAIANQGKTGSCVGWATADSLLRWHLSRAGRIKQSDELSVRFIWMAAKELDELVSAPTTFIEPEGTTLKAALDVARKYGVVLEGDLPFAGGGLYPDAAAVFYAKAAQLKIASYFNLGINPTSWRRWLANNGPILIRLNVDDTWQGAPEDGRLETYRPETAQGGHAVALVGYDSAGFIVRNSWGETWGDKGFAYASDAYALAAFTEAYGVSLGDVTAKVGLASDVAAFATAAISTVVPPIARIEAVVKQKASHLTGRDIHLGQNVGPLFPDGRALDRLLAQIQDALEGAGLLLTSRPTDEKAKLLKGTFVDLADWVLRTLNAGATA